VLVETSEDESTDKNEKHAKRRLDGMAYRQDPLAPALWRGASLPSINDYDLTTRRMDVDAPRPRRPFCGRPMQFRFNELSTLQTFDCNGCQVLLNVPSQSGVPGIALPVLARDVSS
jgi:hypothetical protein